MKLTKVNREVKPLVVCSFGEECPFILACIIGLVRSNLGWCERSLKVERTKKVVTEKVCGPVVRVKF